MRNLLKTAFVQMTIIMGIISCSGNYSDEVTKDEPAYPYYNNNTGHYYASKDYYRNGGYWGNDGYYYRSEFYYYYDNDVPYYFEDNDVTKTKIYVEKHWGDSYNMSAEGGAISQ